MNWLLVFIGGGVGSIIRFFISQQFSSHFPFATLISNAIASFFLGFVYIKFRQNGGSDSPYWYLLAVGICGGFSTFSAFSLESMNLLFQHQTLYAIGNVLLNVLLCFGLIFVGFTVAKWV